MSYVCRKNGYDYYLKLYNLSSTLFPVSGGLMNCSYTYNSAGASNYYHPVLTITFKLAVDSAVTPASGATISFSYSYSYKTRIDATSTTVSGSASATYSYKQSSTLAKSGYLCWYTYVITKDPGYSLTSWSASSSSVTISSSTCTGSINNKTIYLSPLTKPTITFSTNSSGYVVISIKNSNSSAVDLNLTYMDIYDANGGVDYDANLDNLSGTTISANSTLTYTVIGSAEDSECYIDATRVETIDMVATFKTSSNMSLYVYAGYES